MENEFDEKFEESTEDEEYQKSQQEPQEGAITKVRTPRGKEVLGKVEQRVGANRMIISCFDGKQRNCRVPGRLRRKLWIREGNIVLIEPWEFEGDKKGDIIWAYTPAQIQWLEKKGFLKDIQNEF